MSELAASRSPIKPAQRTLLRKLLAKASPAPWVWNRDRMSTDSEPRVENADGDRQELWWTWEDSHLTVELRNIAPEMLDYVELLEERVKRACGKIRDLLDVTGDDDDFADEMIRGAQAFLQEVQPGAGGVENDIG